MKLLLSSIVTSNPFIEFTASRILDIQRNVLSAKTEASMEALYLELVDFYSRIGMGEGFLSEQSNYLSSDHKESLCSRIKHAFGCVDGFGLVLDYPPFFRRDFDATMRVFVMGRRGDIERKLPLIQEGFAPFSFAAYNGSQNDFKFDIEEYNRILNGDDDDFKGFVFTSPHTFFDEYSPNSREELLMAVSGILTYMNFEQRSLENSCVQYLH